MIETDGSLGPARTIVRRGLRCDKYVATYKFKWSTPCQIGFLVRWLGPGNWLAINVESGKGKAQLRKKNDDAAVTTVATSASSLSLTSGNWYTAKVVVDDDWSAGWAPSRSATRGRDRRRKSGEK